MALTLSCLPGIQEADMQGQVNANVRVVETEHIKGMPEIERSLIAVPSPMGIRIGEMSFTGTMGDTVFHAFADLMLIRGSVGMDTDAGAGKGDAVRRDKPAPEGREECGTPENLLEPFLIMEGECAMLQGVSGHGVCNAGMPVGKLFPLLGFLEGFEFLSLGKRSFLPVRWKALGRGQSLSMESK